MIQQNYLNFVDNVFRHKQIFVKYRKDILDKTKNT